MKTNKEFKEMKFSKLHFLIFAGIFLVSSSVHAECIPSDDPCAPKKKIGDWDTSLLFGFNLTQGNSETTLLNIGANTHFEQDQSIFDAGLEYGYGEDKTNQVEGQDTKTRDDLRATAQYDHLLSERFFVGLGTKVLYDDIADIDYRANVNPSLGYYLLRDNSFKFRVEAGPSYVFEKVGGEKDDYFAPRLAEGFEWAITCTSKLFQKAEILFDTADSDNYLIDAEAGIEAAISSSLSLVVKVRETYDNVPAEDRDRSDLAVISAIKVQL